MPNQLPKERRDDIDRREQPAAAKLLELAEMVKETMGQDPRGGGWSYVARPHIVKQCLDELSPVLRTLAPKFSYSDTTGRGTADVVFTWNNITIRVRHKAKGDIMHAIRDADLPPSLNVDRRVAGELRIAAWNTSQS